MILETGLVILGGYMYHFLNTKDERNLKSSFKGCMEGIGLYNKNKETFALYGVNQTKYGWRGAIKIPNGLSLEHLNSKLNILEDNLSGIIEVDKDRFKNHINFYMINKDVDKFKYEPVKTRPYEIYIGKDFRLKDFILNTRKDPMIVIGGVTGTGKSFLLAVILTNLIYNSSDKIELYLLQIAKSELSAFEDCPCVKKTCYTEASCSFCLTEVMAIINKRSELFKQNAIKNISQWNTHYKKRYMKEIYIVIEELSFFEEDENILKISKIGRSVGVHIISCIQRTVATEMNPTLKSQMTRISFHQKSSLDSTNIIGTPDAKHLKERECIVNGNNDYTTIKTPWVDEDYILLHKYVPTIRIPNNNQSKVIVKDKKEDLIIEIDEENSKVTMLDEHNLIEVDEVKEETKDINTEKLKDESVDYNSAIMSLEEYENVKRKGL